MTSDHVDESVDITDSTDEASVDAPAPSGDDRPVDAELVGEISEEAVVALIAERDEYLEALQRLKAEFANHRRRSEEQAAARRQQAAADLVEKILPVLDSCDAAITQGVDEVRPIADALFEALAAQGLARVHPDGEPFDPERHEAVLYEAGEGEQVVIETLRTGYSWNERVLRAPMVKVQG